MKKIEWVALDLDGTIIDSTDHLYNVYKAFLKEFNCRGSRKEFEKLNGPKLVEIISILKKRYNINEKKSNLIKNYNNKINFAYKNKIYPKKNTKKILTFLKQNQYKIGLVTSSNKKNTDLILKKNDLFKYFSIIVYGDDVSRAKPYPDIYKTFLKKINSYGRNVLAVEDSQNGYNSAKNAGIDCLKINNLSGLIKKLSESDYKTYEIIKSKKIQVQIKPFKKKISSSQKRRINTVWKNEQKNRKKKLFNSKVLSLKSILQSKKQVSINSNFVDYKYIIADRLDPIIGLNLKQVGISGMILFSHRKINYTLFAKRSKNSTEYPGYYELVPSGNLDNLSKQSKGILEYKSKLLVELEEEAGITASNVKEIFEICIINDKNNNVYDICCLIKLKISKTDLTRNIRKSIEYSNPKIVRIKDVPQFIKKNNKKIIPTTLGLLTYYLKSAKLIY